MEMIPILYGIEFMLCQFRIGTGKFLQLVILVSFHSLYGNASFLHEVLQHVYSIQPFVQIYHGKCHIHGAEISQKWSEKLREHLMCVFGTYKAY